MVKAKTYLAVFSVPVTAFLLSQEAAVNFLSKLIKGYHEGY